MKKKMVAGVYEWEHSDADPNKKPGSSGLKDIDSGFRLDWIKGDCCTVGKSICLLSAILTLLADRTRLAVSSVNC